MSMQKTQKVAIIGAGISGVVAASHLLQYGLQVTVFERSSGPGERYDARPAREPAYPSETPSVGDYVSFDGKRGPYDAEDEGYSSDIDILHAPPGFVNQNASLSSIDPDFQSARSCYMGLMNNVSTPLMRTSLGPWPEGTEDFVNHRVLEDYITALSRSSGVNLVTHYNTRVEDVKKTGKTWVVRTSSLTRVHTFGRRRLISKYWEFDAVVVASGHYNAPRIPDADGLQQWKERWPDRIQHSKGYRSPDMFKDKNVFLVGAGVSSTDIARELASKTAAVYQSSRGGDLDLPSSLLPPNAFRIGGVAKFEIPAGDPTTDGDITLSEPIPGTILLVDGAKLCNIHHVILCTGYMTSYPFLKQFHRHNVPTEQAPPDILVTAEGSQVHNLHKDIFYIPDPTLAFIGTPYHTATFSLFEFQAVALARVFAGTCQLPAEHEMCDEYTEKKKRKSLGRDFHSLRGYGEEEAYVNELVEWVNRDATVYGAEPMKGHSEEWLAANKAREERLRWLRERKVRPG